MATTHYYFNYAAQLRSPAQSSGVLLADEKRAPVLRVQLHVLSRTEKKVRPPCGARACLRSRNRNSDLGSFVQFWVETLNYLSRSTSTPHLSQRGETTSSAPAKRARGAPQRWRTAPSAAWVPVVSRSSPSRVVTHHICQSETSVNRTTGVQRRSSRSGGLGQRFSERTAPSAVALPTRSREDDGHVLSMSTVALLQAAPRTGSWRFPRYTASYRRRFDRQLRVLGSSLPTRNVHFVESAAVRCAFNPHCHASRG